MIDFIAKIFHKKPEEVCREWHCLEIGFAEMFCFRVPSVVSITDFARLEIKNEWHYYQVGRFGGVLSWVIILAILL